MIVEAQEHHLRRHGFGVATLAAELQAHNYQFYELARLGLTEVTFDGTRRTTTRRGALDTPDRWGRNWLALPPRLADQADGVHRHLVRCGLLPCIPGVNPLAKRLV